MKNIQLLFLLVFLSSAFTCPKRCIEKIKPDCICTMQYDPVCGCNNKTYGNACVAECSGITKYTKGACKQNATTELEGQVWKLVTFAGSTQPIPPDVTITIKFEGGKIDSHGGCNRVGGAYIHDGNSLTVSGLISTKMYCEKAMKWETMFLERLEKSQSYSIVGNTLTIICGSKGNMVFQTS